MAEEYKKTIELARGEMTVYTQNGKAFITLNEINIPIEHDEIGGVAYALAQARDRLLNVSQIVEETFIGKVYTSEGYTAHLAIIPKGTEIYGPRKQLRGDVKTLCGRGHTYLELGILNPSNAATVYKGRSYNGVPSDLCKSCMKKLIAMGAVPTFQKIENETGKVEQMTIDFAPLNKKLREGQ